MTDEDTDCSNGWEDRTELPASGRESSSELLLLLSSPSTFTTPEGWSRKTPLQRCGNGGGSFAYVVLAAAIFIDIPGNVTDTLRTDTTERDQTTKDCEIWQAQ
jgi:hypothetical protein